MPLVQYCGRSTRAASSCRAPPRASKTASLLAKLVFDLDAADGGREALDLGGVGAADGGAQAQAAFELLAPALGVEHPGRRHQHAAHRQGGGGEVDQLGALGGGGDAAEAEVGGALLHRLEHRADGGGVAEGELRLLPGAHAAPGGEAARQVDVEAGRLGAGGGDELARDAGGDADLQRAGGRGACLRAPGLREGEEGGEAQEAGGGEDGELLHATLSWERWWQEAR